MRSCLNASLGDGSACLKVPSREPASVKDVYWWRKEVCKKCAHKTLWLFSSYGEYPSYCHPNIKKKEVYKKNAE